MAVAQQAMLVRRVGRLCALVLACMLAVSAAWAQEPAESRVDDLIEALKDKIAPVRLNAAEALGKIMGESNNDI